MKNLIGYSRKLLQILTIRKLLLAYYGKLVSKGNEYIHYVRGSLRVGWRRGLECGVCLEVVREDGWWWKGGARLQGELG